MYCTGKLCDITITKRASDIRVLFCEIGRVLNHLLNITTQGMDVGAPPIFGGLKSEKSLWNSMSGRAVHGFMPYFRPGGVHQDLQRIY